MVRMGSELAELDLQNAAHVKIALLREGVTIGPAIQRHVRRQYAEKLRAYAGSDDLASRGLEIPQELILPGEHGEVIVDVHHRVNSRWRVDFNDGGAWLFCQKKQICAVKIPRRPAYYGRRISSGRLAERVGSMYGVYVLAFFGHGHCVLYDQNLQCAFCSLSPTRADYDDVERQVCPEDAVEVTRLAFSTGDAIRYVMLCDGNYTSNDYGFLRALALASAIRPHIPDDVPLHMLIMPPDDLSLLQRLAQCGVDTISFSLETIDPELFASVCPGKQKFYGHDKIRQALREAST